MKERELRRGKVIHLFLNSGEWKISRGDFLLQTTVSRIWEEEYEKNGFIRETDTEH